MNKQEKYKRPIKSWAVRLLVAVVGVLLAAIAVPALIGYVGAGSHPVSVTTTAGLPSHPLRVAYTANQSWGTVTAYRITSSPSLPIMIPAGRFPVGPSGAASVTTHPSVNVAYVANKLTNTVWRLWQ
jgi:hypothetical protein